MFCSVARHSSLVAAARELHLTPSAISHGLKALETEVGCRLFDRTGKKLLLNQAGEHLLTQVQPPMAAIEAAAESVKRLGKWGQTRLRIGAPASACQYILPPVIRELKKSFGNATLQIESGDMADMVQLIQQNRIDLALGLTPNDTAGLEIRPVFSDELLFVFSPSHSWVSARTISREDLRVQPLILYQRTSLTAQTMEAYFHSLDLVPSTIMEIASTEAIKELVKLNLGVSVMAPWAADRELVRGSLRMRPLGSKPVRRHWVVASLAGRRLSLIEETFCRLCRQIASGLRMDRRDIPALDR